jgi:GNAT superfamily N-acetyltransferase
MTTSHDAAQAYLAAYDARLRTDAETPSALSAERLGPLRLVVFPGGTGFITCQDLGGLSAQEIRDLVPVAVDRLVATGAVSEIEWKTRGHDHAPGLHEALENAGFLPDEPESIMIGPAAALADVPEPGEPGGMPVGVRLRRITAPDEVLAMSRMAGVAFGDAPGEAEKYAEAIGARLERESSQGHPEPMEVWAAEVGEEIVSAGRLEPVPGTEFAGLWGGSTHPDWRGRGIYRALTAARARSALALGKTLIHSDSSEYSRPILERYGFLRVSTTTPYRLRLD